MLDQFTWQQFMIAAVIFALLWYAAVILLFYRKELHAFLGGRDITDHPAEPLLHRREKEARQDKDRPENDLIGPSRMPEGLSTVSVGAFGFVPDGDAREDQVGLVPDVLEELKNVFNILAKEDGTKNDFFSLVRLISEKYPGIGSNPNIGRINEWIVERAPFHLSQQELEDLWV